MMNTFYPGQAAEYGGEILWNDFACRSDQGWPQPAAADVTIALHAEETVRLRGDDHRMNPLGIRVAQAEAHPAAI
jgi:hypothetical protein